MKCNTYNLIDRKTCKSCGRALPVDEGKKCVICGNLNGPFAKACRSCGIELGQGQGQKSPKEEQINTNEKKLRNRFKNNLGLNIIRILLFILIITMIILLLKK